MDKLKSYPRLKLKKDLQESSELLSYTSTHLFFPRLRNKLLCFDKV